MCLLAAENKYEYAAWFTWLTPLMERFGWESAYASPISLNLLNLWPVVFSLSLQLSFLTLLVSFNSPNVLKIPVYYYLFLRSSCEEAIWGNVRIISPICDMLTSYWDQVRGCLAAHLVHCSAGAFRLPICFCWPFLNQLPLSFHVFYLAIRV